MFTVQKITREQHMTSRWTGGTTTQLAIYPPQADYGKRNFIWRISSATVEQETSVFTSLPDYNRIISVVSGELSLTHENRPLVMLKPFDQDDFDGGIQTVSTGKVTDFNIMARKGQCQAVLETLRLAAGSCCTLAGYSRKGAYNHYTRAIYCAQGEVEIKVSSSVFDLDEGDLLLLSTQEEENFSIKFLAKQDTGLFISDLFIKQDLK